MKRLKELFNRYRLVSSVMLTLFAVCSVVLVSGVVRTYAISSETIYMRDMLESAGVSDFSNRVHLFKSEYNSGKVKSSDGTNIIAPNTDNSYTLNIVNNSDYQLYYSFTVNAVIKNAPMDPTDPSKPLTFPVSMKMTGPGGVRKFSSVGDMKGDIYSTYHDSPKGKVDTFRFDWSWDTVSDMADTVWGDAADSAYPPEIDVYIEVGIDMSRREYVISFDPGEGTLIGADSKIVYFGQPHGELPGASRTDYAFRGWYTEPGGNGKLVAADTIADAGGNITVYAKWVKNVSTDSEDSVPGLYDENGRLQSTDRINAGKPTPVRGYTAPGDSGQVTVGEWRLIDAQDKKWVFAGADGYASNGWYLVGNQYSEGGAKNQWYHFNEYGVMDIGWFRAADNEWYHLREISDGDLGCLERGWYHDRQDGRTYYLDMVTGRMLYGWQKIGEDWYYFATPEDVSASNWIQVSSGDAEGSLRWVYDSQLRSFGSMYAGEYTPSGHYVMADGRWDRQGEPPVHSVRPVVPQQLIGKGAIGDVADRVFEVAPEVGFRYQTYIDSYH
ncbi:MAG: InlB B-repeat-containing protein [Eubacteriales bacterium]|nr:InlB B-repeat-containing protein [Eubacteriales bacterium]